MRRTQSGFTLIELLIVISIIGVLAAVLLPRVIETRAAANASADAFQLKTHAFWIEDYKRRHKGFLPGEGGHRFVLSLWTTKIFEHTEENLDKFFTPGSADPHWQEVRGQMERGTDPWPDLSAVGTEDTHYCGRAKQHLRGADGASDALMANDNEGVWSLSDGTVNVLFADGNVRTYFYTDLQSRFGLADFDKENPLQTWGPNSPIPECQKLDN